MPTPVRRCPKCGVLSGQPVSHKIGCPIARVSSVPVKPKFTCLACEDTGVNSKGNPCHPCVVHGRVNQNGGLF